MIIDDAATRMSIVRSEPYSDSSVIAFVRPNDAVRIVDKKPEGTKIIWYQIAYGDAAPLGWVRYDYVVLSAACPK